MMQKHCSFRICDSALATLASRPILLLDDYRNPVRKRERFGGAEIFRFPPAGSAARRNRRFSVLGMTIRKPLFSPCYQSATRLLLTRIDVVKAVSITRSGGTGGLKLEFWESS